MCNASIQIQFHLNTQTEHTTVHNAYYTLHMTISTSSKRLGKFEILWALLTSIEWACWYPMLYMSHDCLPLKPYAMTKTP